MSIKALIKGQVYTLLELLPSLDQNENMILCANTLGERYGLEIIQQIVHRCRF